MKTIYVKDLGKCVAKHENYRAFKEGGLFRLYLVGREMLFTETSMKLGKRLEAIPVGYFTDIKNFHYAIDEAREETAYLMAQGV